MVPAAVAPSRHHLPRGWFLKGDGFGGKGGMQPRASWNRSAPALQALRGVYALQRHPPPPHIARLQRTQCHPTKFRLQPHTHPSFPPAWTQHRIAPGGCISPSPTTSSPSPDPVGELRHGGDGSGTTDPQGGGGGGLPPWVGAGRPGERLGGCQAPRRCAARLRRARRRRAGEISAGRPPRLGSQAPFSPPALPATATLKGDHSPPRKATGGRPGGSPGPPPPRFAAMKAALCSNPATPQPGPVMQANGFLGRGGWVETRCRGSHRLATARCNGAAEAAHYPCGSGAAITLYLRAPPGFN